ncbi:MAG TPA: type II toxin-antitoxin system prevent-host-death family antitoxin [Allosphingosinicella sp.]|jgi:prevent-host-death family protein
MEVPLSIAKAKLCELVHRAEAGEDIIITEWGRRVARLEPVKPAAVAVLKKP